VDEQAAAQPPRVTLPVAQQVCNRSANASLTRATPPHTRPHTHTTGVRTFALE
jgi:hypothetical protein